MKSAIKYLGLTLILLGVAALVGIHLIGFPMANNLILIPFALIVAGAVIYVWRVKKESRY